MHKLWLLIVTTMAFVLAACSAVKAPTPDTIAQPAVPTQDPNATPMECQVARIIPAPDPTDVALFPPAGPTDWVRGKESATLTITEYSDFQ